VPSMSMIKSFAVAVVAATLLAACQEDVAVEEGVSSGPTSAPAPQPQTPPPTSPPGAPANNPPLIAGTPPSSVVAGVAYNFTPAASDPDGQSLAFAIQNKPVWAAFDTATGRLSGTPSASNVGSYAGIVISVSDGSASTSLPVFSIAVDAPAAPIPNRPPTITGAPAVTANVGVAYSFVPAASDPDNNALTFSIQNRPTWMAFDAATGRLSGTPAAGNAGAYSNIIISVSDGLASASLPAFTLTVVATAPPPNRPPTISGSPATTATVGTAYAFQPTANDPDGNPLTFSVQNKPTWLNFNAGNGSLSGTPQSANVGTASNIVISVSDGTATVALAAFSIAVQAPPNRAPTISGSPTTSVQVGTAYSFRPNAADPDGNTLTFSIQNKPNWAAFNATNGSLTGTPTAADVGTTNNIVISVSDGTATAALPGFSLAVTQVTNGSAEINWTAPTRNTDGSTLTGITGYKILYGANQAQLDRSVTISNPGVLTYTIENLSPGTWYFSVRTLVGASESTSSNPVNKTIQ
jgi:hypothetical protein